MRVNIVDHWPVSVNIVDHWPVSVNIVDHWPVSVNITDHWPVSVNITSRSMSEYDRDITYIIVSIVSCSKTKGLNPGMLI